MRGKFREAIGRIRAQAGIALAMIGMVCLLQGSDLGWHLLIASQQHLGPHAVVQWDSHAKGGWYTSYDYTFPELIWSTLAYLAVSMAALLALGWRHGYRLRFSMKITPQPPPKRR